MLELKHAVNSNPVTKPAREARKAEIQESLQVTALDIVALCFLEQFVCLRSSIFVIFVFGFRDHPARVRLSQSL